MIVPSSFEGARLKARRIKPDDGVALFEAYAGDPDATRYLPWRTNQRPSETLAFSRLAASRWDAGEEFVFVACLKDTPGEKERIIGSGKIAAFHPLFRNHMEIGFCISPKFWRQGYGTELSSELLRVALEIADVFRVSAWVQPENVACCAVLEKIGMRRECIVKRSQIHPNFSSRPVDMALYAAFRDGEA
ncbi:MAG: GNAT family N-acetyltransferase [Deltaproteobacteria bacterium]|nr:GNAT family N-acetyltransferase [Deltaproteobacteria bacterium]